VAGSSPASLNDLEDLQPSPPRLPGRGGFVFLEQYSAVVLSGGNAMRLSTYVRDGRTGIAAWFANELHGLEEGAPGYPGNLDTLLSQGASLMGLGATLASAPHLDPSTIRLLPPLCKPSKILCIGLNYRDHAAETGFKLPDWPAVFARFPSCLVGAGSPLVRPAVSEQLDFEGEMVVVIGKRAKAVPVEQALSHVAAYSIFNDASVRDYQMRSSQWTLGKNFDATGGFGPWLVTPDELPSGGEGLHITTRINGSIVQNASTSDMVFNVASLINILSSTMTLEPGDMIVTGTPSGVGYTRTPPLFLKPGDICEVEIEKIGILSNPVICV
jgi:2-keto-4-pentenoate hydratase/2-oxohepta-3-ene-1,7-dioic acid hydratase in catechol pathway